MTTSLPASTGRSSSRAMLIQEGRYSRDWGCSREWGCLRERRMSRGEPTARTEPISKLCTSTRPVARTRLSRKRNRRCDLGRQIFTHTCKLKNFEWFLIIFKRPLTNTNINEGKPTFWGQLFKLNFLDLIPRVTMPTWPFLFINSWSEVLPFIQSNDGNISSYSIKLPCFYLFTMNVKTKTTGIKKNM